MSIPDPGSRIRIFPIPDPGSKFFASWIPDPGSEFFPSRILDPGCALKNLSILTKKKWFLSLQKYDPSFRSRIWIQDLDPDFLPILVPDPGSQIPNPGIKKAPDPWSWIPDPDLQHWRFQVCSGCRGWRWLLTFNGPCCLNNSFNGSALRSFYVQKRILRIFYFHIIYLIFTLFKLWCPAHLFPNTPRWLCMRLVAALVWSHATGGHCTSLLAIDAHFWYCILATCGNPSANFECVRRYLQWAHKV